VETSEKVNPKYLAWFINLPQTQVLIRSKAQATSISLVTKANFEELKIELPALSIQNKIVELDDLQKKECALLTALAEKKEILVSAICICAVKRNSK
jgi:restriction endonuclease S subunit